MKTHIVFDFDDTISSSYELNQQLFYETFLPYSTDLDEEYIRNYHKAGRGLQMNELFNHVIRKFGLHVSATKLVLENENLHRERAIDMTIFDGVEELLIYFKATDRIISMCSNRDRVSLEIVLNKYKIFEYFDNIISCSEEGHQKPDPYCLNKLISKYPDQSKDEVICFGDSKTDADFANNAGVECVIVDHYLNSKRFYAVILNTFSI